MIRDMFRGSLASECLDGTFSKLLSPHRSLYFHRHIHDIDHSQQAPERYKVARLYYQAVVCLLTPAHRRMSAMSIGNSEAMLYKTLSAAVFGIDASIIQVEVDCSGIKTDQDHFHTVGLPDAAVRESRDRVRAALKNCGYDIPPTQITINLVPADIKKEGSGFDLPMALGIVGAYGTTTKPRATDRTTSRTLYARRRRHTLLPLSTRRTMQVR
jgi:Mg-chelatase subunit ChlI-like protein